MLTSSDFGFGFTSVSGLHRSGSKLNARGFNHWPLARASWLSDGFKAGLLEAGVAYVLLDLASSGCLLLQHEFLNTSRWNLLHLIC